MTKEVYQLGQIPELGEVPAKMHEQLIGQSCFTEPGNFFPPESVAVPEIGPRDLLAYMMAASVNYNNVWASLGIPIDAIRVRRKKGPAGDTGGSGASGVVWKVGEDVKNVNLGDEVVVQGGWWNVDAPHVLAGKDPTLAPPEPVWGHNTNRGSFVRFTGRQGRPRRGEPGRGTRRMPGRGTGDAPTHNVFVTHCDDTWVAEQIANAISECGATPFLDEQHIHAGADFEKRIRLAIAKANELVILVTPRALQSHYVWIELGAAWLRDIPIIGLLHGISIEELQAQRDLPLLKSRNLLCLNQIAVYLQQLRGRISTLPGTQSPC